MPVELDPFDASFWIEARTLWPCLQVIAKILNQLMEGGEQDIQLKAEQFDETLHTLHSDAHCSQLAA